MTFVTIQAGGGWDTHGDNFKQLKNQLLPNYDQALAALVSDLCDRGLQQEVLVMAMGEFGRTPRINGGAGRDHWPGAMSIVYAGGGLQDGPGRRLHQRQRRIPHQQAVHRPVACWRRCTTCWASTTTKRSTTRPNGRWRS